MILTEDVIYLILRYLDPVSFLWARYSCAKFYSASTSRLLWKEISRKAGLKSPNNLQEIVQHITKREEIFWGRVAINPLPLSPCPKVILFRGGWLGIKQQQLTGYHRGRTHTIDTRGI
jgi:hypothetical protein